MQRGSELTTVLMLIDSKRSMRGSYRGSGGLVMAYGVVLLEYSLAYEFSRWAGPLAARGSVNADASNRKSGLRPGSADTPRLAL